MAPLPVIRVNTQVNFPALVKGSGPITVAKANGVWTVGLSTAIFAQIYGILPGVGRPQRSVGASPIVISGVDQILNINIPTGAPTCALPQASTRSGVPLTFKDVGANFAAHNLTLTPFAGDTIDGAASLVLSIPRQSITLVPFNDGVNGGWFIS